MSVKHYCDGCGKEIDRSYVTDRFIPTLLINTTGSYVKVKAEVQLSVNGTWNRGDICRDCLLRVLTEGGE